MRSIKVGFFKLLKHVGSLIKLFRFYVAQNSEKMGFEVSALKYPRTSISMNKNLDLWLYFEYIFLEELNLG